MTHTVITARQKEPRAQPMLSRTATASVAGRATSMRRLRRRASAASTSLTRETRTFCRTNGCASFLEVDPGTGTATCPICGYVRFSH